MTDLTVNSLEDLSVSGTTVSAKAIGTTDKPANVVGLTGSTSVT